MNDVVVNIELDIEIWKLTIARYQKIMKPLVEIVHGDQSPQDLEKFMEVVSQVVKEFEAKTAENLMWIAEEEAELEELREIVNSY